MSAAREDKASESQEQNPGSEAGPAQVETADAMRDYHDKIVPGLSTRPSIGVTGRHALQPGSTPMSQAEERSSIGVVK